MVKTRFTIIAALVFLPTFVWAADAASLVGKILEQIVNPAILVIVALATLMFFYGIFRAFASKGSEEMRTRGKTIALWGIAGLFIMVGVYGIMQLIITTVGADGQVEIDDSGQIDITVPDLDFSS